MGYVAQGTAAKGVVSGVETGDEERLVGTIVARTCGGGEGERVCDRRFCWGGT